MTFLGVFNQGTTIIHQSPCGAASQPKISRYRGRQRTARFRHHTMGKKRASLTTGSMSSSIEKSKKAKKRRRESAPGSAAGGLVESSTSGGQEKEKRRSHKSSSSSSTEVVLRCASKDDVSPIVVSFANQTVPHDMSALKFAVHSGEDEARRGQRVVMGEGPR